MKKVLYVEDDLNLATTVKSILQMDGLDVVHVDSFDKAIQQFDIFKPNVLLLDILLNDKKDGLDIADEIRKISDIPILFISTLSNDRHLSRAFNIRNSDYIRKPFSIIELLFRVNKKLNRINIASSSKQQYRLKRLNFVPFEKVIYLHSTPVHLSSLESAVLTILCENMDKFVDKNMIIREVWDVEDTKSKEASFNNVISKLRKILRAEHEVKIESGLKAKVRITLG